MSNTTYLVTFYGNNSKGMWTSSKWKVTAESRSQALHYSNLMHDNEYDWHVDMITISRLGFNNINPSNFTDLDRGAAREEIEVLDRIWQKKFDKMENV